MPIFELTGVKIEFVTKEIEAKTEREAKEIAESEIPEEGYGWESVTEPEWRTINGHVLFTLYGEDILKLNGEEGLSNESKRK